MTRPSFEEIARLDHELLTAFTPPGADCPLCVWCYIRKGVTIHEIVPRSLAPDWWWHFGNRVPLCHEDHMLMHSDRKKYEATLRFRQEEALRRVRSWTDSD